MGFVDMITMFFGIVGGDAPAEPMQEYRAEIPAAEVRVVDGDTIRYGGGRVRLMGFDTPETFDPGCASELRRGEAATAHLQALVASGAPVALAMSGRQDRYGRHLGRLYVGGTDVADLMIDAGLARAYHGGSRGSWCDGAGEGTP